MADDLLAQLLVAPIIFDALGCACFQKHGFEADDVMATISRWARNRGLNAVHVSSDKDMLQLVDHGVHVMKPRERQLMGMTEFYIYRRVFTYFGCFC